MHGRARLDMSPKQNPIKRLENSTLHGCVQCLRNYENTNCVSFFTSSWINNTLLHSTGGESCEQLNKQPTLRTLLFPCSQRSGRTVYNEVS